MQDARWKVYRRTVWEQQRISEKHAGVIAWSRAALPDLGEYGDPEILFQAGEIGDLE
jgi:hypothetical protein